MIIRPKGTIDYINERSKLYNKIEKIVQEVMDVYNFSYIRTPVFEHTELFRRGVGEGSDIVNKEMYDFVDKKGRNLTLRPEGTAGIVRAYIENKMANNLIKPVKLYYLANMYRYERPQKGRFREFIQFGMEVFADTQNAFIDIEPILAVYEIFKRLNITGLKLKINSLGCSSARQVYQSAIKEYFSDKLDRLCSDCHERLNKNPLRILDCKIDDLNSFDNKPKIRDYLSTESKEYFDKFKSLLELNNIEYEVSDNLVRGLDYYDEVVFEIVKDDLTICGGGRYNNLVSDLGGSYTPAFGLAIGIERLIDLLPNDNLITNDFYIIAVSDTERLIGLKLASKLRALGIKCEFDKENKSIKAQFKQSDNLNTKYLIFMNDENLKNGYVEIKSVQSKDKVLVKLDKIEEYYNEKNNE